VALSFACNWRSTVMDGTMADAQPQGSDAAPLTAAPPTLTPPIDDLLAATPLFARVFRHSPVSIIILAANGRIVAANDAFGQLLGRPPDALVGHTARGLGLLDAGDSERAFAPQPDDPRADIPLQQRSPDGRVRHFIASSQPITIGGEAHVVSYIRDVSELNRLSDALTQSEERFRLFFENAPLALVVSDAATGQIVDVNTTACRQYDYSRADFLNVPAEQLAPLVAAAAGLAQHTTAAGRSLDVDTTTFSFDLADRHLQMNALLDVTEQTATAQALRDSEERFRIVAEVSNDGLWDWDLTGDRVWRNNRLQLYGQFPYGPDHPWATRIHPDDLQQGIDDFTHAVDAHQPGWTSEYRVQRADDSWATVLQRGFILYEGDQPVRALGATMDITAPLQLAEAEAQAVLAERERLARDLHDSVTQSLYSVSLLAEAARRRALEEQEPAAAEFIGRLGSLAHQALRQMRLLVYELRPAVLDTEGLAGALRHRLDAVEKRAGIKVNLVIRGERPIPTHLQGEMYRIAHEALNNALAHAGATAVTVRLDTLSNPILLEVIDNGRGFDSSASTFGRGLPTMRERCARLGGDLTIDSAAGRGTTLRLFLPLTAP
jgi:PAS domain S-box-containing protein